MTPADLEGITIGASITREQVIRRENWQGPIQARIDWRVSIDPGGIIEMSTTSTVRGPRGERTGKPLGGIMRLARPQQVYGLGGGEAVWEFQDGSLTFIRTFKQGAYRARFDISREAEGLSCKVTEGFARERGGGAIVLNSAIDGKPFMLISSKQVSSTCTASKNK